MPLHPETKGLPACAVILRMFFSPRQNVLQVCYASFQRLRQQRFIVCKFLAADLLKLMEEIFHRQLLLLFSSNV